MATNCITNNCNRVIYNKARQLCQPCNQNFLRKNALPATRDVLANKLWPSVHIADADGCWEWQGVGAKIWNAKLTDNKVIVIKNLLRDGVKVKHLSILCDVSEKSIQQIKDGISWKHIN